MTSDDQPFPPAPLEKSQAMSERVYRSLLQMLGRGTMKRGAVLRIDLLAKSLDVSPTPVREALARLAMTGLVRHEARKGYTIAPPLSREQCAELMDARRLIEVAAIGRACANGGAAFVQQLEEVLQRQRRAVSDFQESREGPNRETFAWNVMESDFNFHKAIFEHTGNGFILVMANALSAQLHRIGQSAQRGISDELHALGEHEAIMAAVRAGDRRSAEAAMTRHMDNVEKRSESDIADD